ncbi:hypothetical protein [Salinigranum sp. GCM10025319]
MTDSTDDRPARCPACGSRDVRERRETGGGWRRVFRCGECGARVPIDSE